MPFTVRRYENTSTSTGKSDITVADASVNTTDTSISIQGTLTTGYEVTIAEGMLHIIENFSSPLPPAGAVTGQIWFRDSTVPSERGLYAWSGDSAADGGDSTDINNWSTIINDLSSAFNTHILETGISNPHGVTGAQLYDLVGGNPVDNGGLANVTNVPIYDKTLNLSDVTSITQGRINLNVYSISDVYTTALYDSLFIGVGDTVVDSFRLGGSAIANYAMVATPAFTEHLNANTIGLAGPEIIISTNSGTTSIIADSVSEEVKLRNGIDLSGNIVTTGDSGIDVTLGNNKFTVDIHDTATAGNAPLVLNKIEYNNTTGLTVGLSGDSVYHTGNLPTSAEVGAYSSTDTVINSSLLGGDLKNSGSVPLTIAIRDFSVLATANVETTDNVDTFLLGTNSGIYYRNEVGNGNDNSIRMTDQDTACSDIDNTVTSKSRGCFNGLLGAGDIKDVTPGTVITKLGVGVYRVLALYKIGKGPDNTDFPIIIGSSDAGSIQTPATNGSFRLTSIKHWVKNVSFDNIVSGQPTMRSLSFDIYAKAIQNQHNGINSPDAFRAIAIDPTTVSFTVIW